ncbi:MAG: hypothetical protein QOG97_3529 [Acidimicrobiaceae bacterium]|nr:hypothetical protein [Acidimicrobiaceae bacterium]
MGFGKSPPPLGPTLRWPLRGPLSRLGTDRLRPDALKRAPISEPLSIRHSDCYPGGAPVPSVGVAVGSTMSCQVPRRRLDCFGLASAIARCFVRKPRMRSELYPAAVKPRSRVIFVWPNTRKKPRLRSAKVPLSAALADSTTCRRPIDNLQAVVPNGMRCHHGNSAGIAVRMPDSTSRSPPRSVPTAPFGATHRLREGPGAQHPGAERAAPPGGAIVVRAGVSHQPLAGPQVELGFVDESSPPPMLPVAGPAGRAYRRASVELAVEQQGIPREGTNPALVGHDLECLMDSRLRHLVMGRPGSAERVARLPHNIVNRRASPLGGDQVVDDPRRGGCDPDTCGVNQNSHGLEK